MEITGPENFDVTYRAEVEKTGPGSSVLVDVLHASDEPLLKEPGFLFPLGAEHIICMIQMTLTAPDLAPPGKHFTTVYATVLDPPFDIDPKIVIDGSFEEFYELIPEARTKSHVLHKGCYRKEWPEFRDVNVFLPQKTPIINLYNVGDGVRIPGLSASTLCAETARVVVDDIVARITPSA